MYDSIYECANVSLFSQQPETIYVIIYKICEKSGTPFDYNFQNDAFQDNVFTITNFDLLVNKSKQFQKLFGLKNGYRFLIDAFCES